MKTATLLILTFFWISASYSQSIEEIIDSANAKIEGQDFKGAIADLSRAIEIDEKNVEALHLRANTKSIVGDNSGAIEDYSNVIL